MDVAPFAGAWIETYAVRAAATGRIKSRPSRARGLKPPRQSLIPPAPVSRPSRARGLKQNYEYGSRDLPGVAPFAGAWIETSQKKLADEIGICRALRGRVD